MNGTGQLTDWLAQAVEPLSDPEGCFRTLDRLFIGEKGLKDSQQFLLAIPLWAGYKRLHVSHLRVSEETPTYVRRCCKLQHDRHNIIERYVRSATVYRIERYVQ